MKFCTFVKKVMDFTGLTVYAAWKKSGKPRYDDFKSMQNKRWRLSPDELRTMRDLYIDSGGSLNTFYIDLNNFLDGK